MEIGTVFVTHTSKGVPSITSKTPRLTIERTSDFSVQVNDDIASISDVNRTNNKAHTNSKATRHISGIMTHVKDDLSNPHADLRDMRRTSDQTTGDRLKTSIATVGHISKGSPMGAKQMTNMSFGRTSDFGIPVSKGITHTVDVYRTSDTAHIGSSNMRRTSDHTFGVMVPTATLVVLSTVGLFRHTSDHTFAKALDIRDATVDRARNKAVVSISIHRQGTTQSEHTMDSSTQDTDAPVCVVDPVAMMPDPHIGSKSTRCTSDQTLDMLVELHTATVGRISDPVLSGIEALLSVDTSRLARISLSVNTDTAGVIFTRFIGHHTLAGSQV
jgi:hypothetical protein